MAEDQSAQSGRPTELVFILGGARSGKSIAAERMAAGTGRVLFVATAEALDEGMKRRIAAHRRYRPDGWDTLEEPIHLSRVLKPMANRYDTFVLDCLTLWVSNLLLKEESDADPEGEIIGTAEKLLDLIEDVGGRWILVSNEVGQGIVPASSLGRTYRDVLGKVNQLVASRADRAYLMVAGLALEDRSLVE